MIIPSEVLETSTEFEKVLMDALASATKEVCRTMANTQCTLKEAKSDQQFEPRGDISALMSIIGDEGEGYVSLSFPIEFARAVVGRLIAEDPDSLSLDDVSDGIGELVNMVCGNTKIVLAAYGDSRYRLSLPTIVRGANHEIFNRAKERSYVLLIFESEEYQFFLQASLNRYIIHHEINELQQSETL